ncbi:hypothetical protein Tco_1509265 [Tanacetum coccineum]
MKEEEHEASKIEEKEESSDIGKDAKIDVYDELVYESLIEKTPSCSLNFDFRIEKGNPNYLKIPCIIGYNFISKACNDLDLSMNIMSLAYYNTIRSQGYEHRGVNFVRIGMDMHMFVRNMSYVMDFTILKNVEANIDPSLSQDLENGFYKGVEKLGPLYRRDIERIDLEILFGDASSSMDKGVT